MLTENGVTTYAALAASSVEALDTMAKGYGARATRYDWIGQATAMAADSEVAA